MKFYIEFIDRRVVVYDIQSWSIVDNCIVLCTTEPVMIGVQDTGENMVRIPMSSVMQFVPSNLTMNRYIK